MLTRNRKASPGYWYDLFGERLSRRDALRVIRDASALVFLGGAGACGGGSRSRVSFPTYPFSLGVASGDPDSDSVVLWTRLGRTALDGAGVAESAVPVRWEIAEDDAFRRVAATGVADARPELGHSVHAIASGLRPGAEYWYRFYAGNAESTVGRTKTAPDRAQSPDSIRFAFASCQNFEHGYFTALEHLAAENADVVFHLGDYIYEARFDSSEAVRDHEAGEVTTLDEYRGRYETYRSDAQLQLAHASAPWVSTFDDHEVDNNWAGVVPEDDQTQAELMLRRAAGFQAFYEFMPMRPASMPVGPEIRVYRALDFGSLMRVFVMDTRQYRTDQPCGDRTKVRCADAFDPSATMMGLEQERWLFDELSASPANWNVMANQVMVSALARQEGDELAYSMDRWDGYVEAQKRFTDFLGNGETSNPVILTGDIHSNWVADVKRDFADPDSAVVATEFVGTSISSGGDGQDGAARLEGIQALNPHIHHFDSHRGYVTVDVSSDVLRADYRQVPYVTRPGAGVSTSVSYVVEDGVPGTRPS